MSSVPVLGDVLGAIAESFEPLEEGLAGGANLAAFLANFGWYLDPASDVNGVVAALGKVPGNLTALASAVADLESASSRNDIAAMTRMLGQLGVTLKSVFESIDSLSGLASDASWPSPLDSNAFWATFPIELSEFLLYTYLERHARRLFVVLRLVGVLREDFMVPLSAQRVAYIKRSVRWDRLLSAISRPQDILSNVYGWGSAFEVQRLLDNLRTTAVAFDLPAIARDAPQSILDAYYAPGSASRSAAFEDSIPVYWAMADVGSSLSMILVELGVLPIPPVGEPYAAAVGLALYPRVVGDVTNRIQLTPDLTADLKGDFVSEAAIRLELRPGDADVLVDPTLSAHVDASAMLDAKRAKPWVLLGKQSSTRLELTEAHARLRTQGQLPNLEFIAELAVDTAALVIDFGEGDTFLKKVIGASPISIDLSVGVAWSSKSGFQFLGQAGLDTVISVKETYGGFLYVDSIALGFYASATKPAASFAVGVSFGLKLGPVSASVDRIGIEVRLEPVEKGQPRGNLGDANIALGFKPPNGIGLKIEAQAVKGGGFLSFDYDKQQYSGVLQLKINNTIDLKAIGILNAKLPDGREGYSLLLIITGEFPPIQLGLGFTLNGVGGLLGINRTAVVDVLRGGLRSGVLDAILFPPDPLGNVPALLNTLSSVFPVAEGRYTFGPMAKIGWGSPTVLTLDLALILEIPDPVRLIVLGRLKAILPDEKNKVAQIRMDALGVLDFNRGELSLDASLYDSKLLTFTLTGDMALRLSWGAEPNFILSIGGFHPSFSAPANLPKLGRMSIVLVDQNKDGVVARVRFESYLALTSNTVQFGSRIDVYFAALGLEVVGFLSFDALFHFEPFALEAQLAAAVALSFNGVMLVAASLDLTLTGPTPWHLFGQAKLVLLGVPLQVPVELKTGQDSQPPSELPVPIDVLALLQTALGDIRNWQPQLPAGTESIVMLRPEAEADKTLLMHPLGVLSVRQRVVPLERTITRFGNAPVQGGETRFKVQALRQVSGGEFTSTALQEQFAMAQYLALSDDEKLARPAFELAAAGLQLGDDGFCFPDDVVLSQQVEYETLTIVPDQPKRSDRLYTLSATDMDSLIPLGAAAQADIRTRGAARYFAVEAQ